MLRIITRSHSEDLSEWNIDHRHHSLDGALNRWESSDQLKSALSARCHENGLLRDYELCEGSPN
jgi:hypothetical protein